MYFTTSLLIATAIAFSSNFSILANATSLEDTIRASSDNIVFESVSLHTFVVTHHQARDEVLLSPSLYGVLFECTTNVTAGVVLGACVNSLTSSDQYAIYTENTKVFANYSGLGFTVRTVNSVEYPSSTCTGRATYSEIYLAATCSPEASAIGMLVTGAYASVLAGGGSVSTGGVLRE
jgi:hypothetical protein